MVEYFKPDFLIIGAAKAATTWLQRCLQAQPSVFMPGPELHYFSREYERGAAWFNSFFDDAPKSALTGEKSNSYFEDREAMRRIKEHMPGVKLILQLRNPIERAYSDYCMLFRRGDVGSKIESYFEPGSRFGNRFLDGGRYVCHLNHIDELFLREQLLVLVYDDVITRPVEHLATIRDFLGLEVLSPIETRVKDKTDAIVPPSVRKVLRGLKPALKPYRDSAWFKKARGLIAKEPSYPPLTPALHDRLCSYYAGDIDMLAKRLDRDLTPWLAAPPTRMQARF